MVNLDYLYNPAAAKPHFDKNYFVDKKLGFQVIEQGTILPHKKIPGAVERKRKIWGAGGITNRNGKFIKESFVHYGIGESYTPPTNQFNTVLKLSFT